MRVTGAASVRVPATSANLGPGFDALGLALSLYDDVAVEVTDDGVQFALSGQGVDDVPRDETHLVVRSMRRALAEMGAQAPGLALSATNRIPHGRGLGSSAAAICAGVVLARALVRGSGGSGLEDDDVVALAGELEGHPDNVAACLLGGATVAWTGSDHRAHAVAIDVDPSIAAVIFIPAFESSTEAARGLLPPSVPHLDAVANGARSALLVTALARRPDLLFTATEDRLHQPYRAAAMPASAALLQRLRSEGLAAVISGAGPTVLVLAASSEQVQRALSYAPPAWSCRSVAIAGTGALAG